MQTTLKRLRRHRGGYALALTLVFLLVSLITFASMMYRVSSNAKVTLRNNQYNMSQAAAESALERVLAQMNRDFYFSSLGNASYYSSLLPDQSGWPSQYQFSDTNGNVNQISVYLGSWSSTAVPLTSAYAGLNAYTLDCTLLATAMPISISNRPSSWVFQVPATVQEQLQFALIPLFQFAIFYNINLEICPGQPMDIRGEVFSNAGIWSGTPNVTYDSVVEAVDAVNTTGADPFALNYGVSSGTPAGNFHLAGQPVSPVSALTLPIAGASSSNPTNVESILNIPPPAYAMGTGSAYSTNGLVYMANEADLIISNAPTGTNLTIYYQSASSPHLIKVTPDYYTLKAPVGGRYTTNYIGTNDLALLDAPTNVLYAGFSFVTNVLFYDWREGWNGGSGISGHGKAVQAVQIDVGLFNTWLATQTNSAGMPTGGKIYDTQNVNLKGGHIAGVWVYNSVPLSGTTLPAVRMINGAQLINPGNLAAGFRRGLTVATPMPMYVLGNYNSQDGSGSALGTNNTLHTLPAGLMADSITILSGSWNDSQQGKRPAPSSTTVNAACLEGIVQTDKSISGDYSGGVENFLRLLENWGGSTLTYNGSIVVMFPSIYATGHWQQTGNYYDAPTRNWAFDANFLKGRNYLPPMTPSAQGIIRRQWTAY